MIGRLFLSALICCTHLQSIAQEKPSPVRLEREIGKPVRTCFNQMITYGAKDKRLSDVLDEIEMKTVESGCKVFMCYLPGQADRILHVTVEKRARSLYELMELVLADTPLQFSMRPTEQIVVYQR